MFLKAIILLEITIQTLMNLMLIKNIIQISPTVQLINQSELEKIFYLKLRTFHQIHLKFNYSMKIQISIELKDESPRMYFEFEDLDYWRSKIIEKQGSSRAIKFK